ncbi:hypothetical protein NT90_09205, partial [Acinetobacter baumannii]
CATKPYESKVLNEIINCLYDEKYFTEDELRYFRNIRGLLRIAPDIKNEKLKVVSAIKSRKNFLKNSLAIGEIIFNDLNYDIESFFSRGSLHEEFYSRNKESILESISLICQFHKEIYQKIDSNELGYLDEGIDKSFYERIFFYTYKIKEFNEAEIKLDFYNYDLIFNMKDNFLLVNDNFEKSKVFGYAKIKMRSFSRSKQIFHEMKDKLTSLENFLNDFFEKSISNNISLYSIVEKPIERIAIQTHFLLDENVFDLFSSNSIFLEEFSQLVITVDENYNEDLLVKKIYEEFTLLDFIKIQRYFYYISFIYKKVYELIKNKEGEEYAFLLRKRSVIPVIKDEQLFEILFRITGKDIESCRSIINKFTNFYENKNDIIDLQYKPLLNSGNFYLVMPTVFAFSNLIRSFCMIERIHLSSYDKVDYMMLDVEGALKEKDFLVEKDFNYGVDEIDIIAFKDNHLFLFECKNPYHPVNDFELRNTFDHISKGFSQLEKIKKIVQDQSKFKDLLSKLKIDFSENIEIHYGVINANRAMYGFTQNGYKVFHANELVNFIKTGLIISNDKQYLCWDSDEFTVKDLIDYIDGRRITNDFHRCMLDLPYSIAYRNYYLSLKTFSFDPTNMGAIAKEKYREVG